MSSIDELFAPDFLEQGELTEAAQQRMAADLEADSLRYLPIASVARAIRRPAGELCQACITGGYPTQAGQVLYDKAFAKHLAKLSPA